MKIGPYEREIAFRAAFDSKNCPACGRWRQQHVHIFCTTCEKQLSVGVMKGLQNRKSFAWAYYEALKMLGPELDKRKTSKGE